MGTTDSQNILYPGSCLHNHHHSNERKALASSLLVCMKDSTWHHYEDTKSNKGIKKKNSLSSDGFACQNGTCNLTYTEHWNLVLKVACRMSFYGVPITICALNEVEGTSSMLYIK